MEEEDALPEGMDRRTRICIRVILIGLLNFLAFTVGYLVIGGEAVHGRVITAPDGDIVYYLRGWMQNEVRVSRTVFVYSAIHSISVWPTTAAVMLAMLTLAKERIVSAMRSTILRGRTFITIFATILTVMIILATILFARTFVTKLKNPEPPTPVTAPATNPP